MLYNGLDMGVRLQNGGEKNKNHPIKGWHLLLIETTTIQNPLDAETSCNRDSSSGLRFGE